MQYDAIRNDIRNGDLLTFSGRSWESSAIRWWTGADISHVAVACWQRFSYETADRLCILESTELGGVRLFPLSLAIEHYQRKGGKTYHQKLITDCGIDGSELIGRIAERWGHGYPRRYQFALMAFGWLRWARQKLRGMGEDLDQYSEHCAETIAWGLMACKVQLLRPPVMWSPKDISLLPWWGPRIELTA